MSTDIAAKVKDEPDSCIYSACRTQGTQALVSTAQTGNAAPASNDRVDELFTRLCLAFIFQERSAPFRCAALAPKPIPMVHFQVRILLHLHRKHVPCTCLRENYR